MGSDSRFLEAEVLAPGLATGPVHVLSSNDRSPDADTRDADLVEEARLAALRQISQLASEGGGTSGEILEAQALILDDPEFTGRVIDLLPDEGGRSAISHAAREAAERLAGLDDPYLRERGRDVIEVGDLWIQALMGGGAPQPEGPSVVVAEEIGVGWLLAAGSGVKGAVVLKGAPTMHAAIVCRNLGIPLLRLTSEEDLDRARRAPRLALDGSAGRIDLDPPDQVALLTEEGTPTPEGPLRIEDGLLEIRSNVASVAETEAAFRFGADGIGLLRSELAFASAGHLLSEAEQTAFYVEVARRVPGLPVTVRLLDVGADKPLRGVSMEEEANPQLGVRGIRFLRRHPELIRTQLRALWRAAATAPIEVMVPMVATLSDWSFALEEGREASRMLEEAGVSFRRPALGMMLEVPAALGQIEDFIRAGVAFFSIGTNDLVQYLYAADRENREIQLPRVPLSLFRLLHQALAPARKAKIPIAACGEMAADPLAAPFLILAGVRELSVAGGRVGEIKRSIAALTSRPWQDPLLGLLEESRDDDELEAGVRDLMAEHSADPS